MSSKVFGMMTYQGMRKAAFNAFKMLNYLGPKRLMSSGGTGSDGVDAMSQCESLRPDIAVVDIVREVARSCGAPMAAVALAWLRAQPGVTSPIARARTPARRASSTSLAAASIGSFELLKKLGPLEGFS